MKKISVNLFNKGLNLDNNPVSVSNDSLIGALNATFITKNGNEVVLQNDMGNASVDKAQLPAGYVPLGAKEHGGIIYIASYNPLTDESQIGCFPSPLRNFATNSDKSLGFKNLCEYDGNTTYEQKIVEISDDNIIRPGDKFIITATESQIADFENYPLYIRLKVLIITSDNQSIDITDELIEPSGHFEHVKFVKNIENDIQDTDYTIYTNRTCGQLCLRAELVIPNKIELSYFSEYKKISDLFPNDYLTKIDGWINWSINHDDSPITSDLINQDTYVTNLHVKVTPYDEYGNIFNLNTISGYESDVNITDGYMYNYLLSNLGDFYYLIYGESDNSIINFNYTPLYIYPPSLCLKTIHPLKKSEQVEFSLIGSGKVTFDTFRYFNDFDNNHLVFNYGLKFYQRDSDYKLTDLYLELINLRDLDAVSWNYNNVNLTKKRIPLNTDNIYGVYTETIDYLSVLQINISSPNTLISTDLINNDDKIAAGQYYLARICAEVNGTTLYKGDWHALLTSDATNYLYENGIQDMLNLIIDNYLELNYNIIDNDNFLDNYEEILAGNANNYFVLTQLSEADLRYEILKSGILSCKHSPKARLIIPKFFPFSSTDISYTPTLNVSLDNAIMYLDNVITDGNYNPTNVVQHINSQLMLDNVQLNGGRNTISYHDEAWREGLHLSFRYSIYSLLISPFDETAHPYSGKGPLFLPYVADISDLQNLVGNDNELNVDNNNNIYPKDMLYCLSEYSRGRNRYTISFGVCNFILDESDVDDINDIANNYNPIQKMSNEHRFPTNQEVVNFIDNLKGSPNLFVFSSCVNDGLDTIYKSLSPVAGSTEVVTTYDMLLMRTIHDKLCLIGDIFLKGESLTNFKNLFNKIYIYKPDLQIFFSYWTGNKNQYFATNDYHLQFNYTINIQSLLLININNYNSSSPIILDNVSINLVKFKFNKKNYKKNYTKIVNSIEIGEKVSSFLNNSSNSILLGNLAYDGTNYIEYSINPDNTTSPFILGECYLLKNDGNNYLVNTKLANLPSNDPSYNLVNAINNNYLILNDSNLFVLNTNVIPNDSIYYCYGKPDYVSSNVYTGYLPLYKIFWHDTNDIKLFT